jgi:hypothetical protein
MLPEITFGLSTQPSQAEAIRRAMVEHLEIAQTHLP